MVKSKTYNKELKSKIERKYNKESKDYKRLLFCRNCQ